MWFKNLQIYRLPVGYALTADQMERFISAQTFTPCTTLDLQSKGWISPRENGALVHAIGRQMLIKMGFEKKLLPASVINQVAKARAAEIEERQGFAPGRKQMKEVKEMVADELLPRAFSVFTSTMAWIDPVNGWLAIDAASPSKADEVLKLLLKSVDKFPINSLHVKQSPVAAMTDWLATDEAPIGFTIDKDTELRAIGQGKATVRYVRHTLEADDARRHIGAGKQCTRLAMTWADKVSFVLTESLAIKRIEALDVLKENAASTDGDADERFDGDMMLMTGELACMLADLVEALGGEHDEQVDLVSKEAQEPAESVDAAGNVSTYFSAEDGDPMYDQALAVVLGTRRASISLVQRHLHIGYNRAARLLEAMEHQGVIGPMQSNGSRDILYGVTA